MQNEQRIQTISQQVLVMTTKFKSKHDPSFIGHLTNVLQEATERMPANEMIYFCKTVLSEIPKKFDVMPSLREFSDYIDSRRSSNRRPKVTPKEWISEKCPGIPAIYEAMCSKIKSDDQRGLRLMLAFLGLSEEKAWDIYGFWHEGKVHPLVKNPAPSLKELFDFIGTRQEEHRREPSRLPSV